MSMFDWVLLAVVAASALFGLMRGFVGVLASLAAWVLAGWAAFRFGAQVALVLAGDGDAGPGELLAGYALSFIGVLIVVGLVGWLVRKLVQSVGLSGLDRLLGLALGLARGAFVACALVLLLGLTAMPREPQWQRSQVVPVFVPGAQWLRTWLPDWVAAQVDLDGHEEALPAPQAPAGNSGNVGDHARNGDCMAKENDRATDPFHRSCRHHGPDRPVVVGYGGCPGPHHQLHRTCRSPGVRTRGRTCHRSACPGQRDGSVDRPGSAGRHARRRRYR